MTEALIKLISSIARWPASRAATMAVSSIMLKSLFSNTIFVSRKVCSLILDRNTALFYSNLIMTLNQQLNRKHKFFIRATRQQRFLAGIIFLAIAAGFGLFALAVNDKIDLSWWLRPCGFKQRFGLPCPTCGMTTALFAFVQSRIIEAFYIQPAGALLYCILVVIAFLALFTAVFGIYFEFIRRFFAEVKLRYIILALIVIIAAGWAVTLAQALAASNQL